MTSAGHVIRTGIWALADQALFASANFIVRILLANWLSLKEFGAFSTAFAAFLLVGVVHTGMLTEPMLVFAQERYRTRMSPYLTALIGGHTVLSIIASAVLALVGLVLHVYGQRELASAMYCFAIAEPFILLPWLMRRACYAQLRPHRAAAAGAMYLVLMVGLLVGVHLAHALSTATALAMMGVSGLVAGVWLAWGSFNVGSISPDLVSDILSQHWKYGSWATATQLLTYLPGNVYYFLLPQMSSLEESGALAALNNLFSPLMQANAAICLLLLPGFVRTLGTPQAKHLHRLALALLGGGPLLCWLVVGLLHNPIMSAVYRDKYQQYAPLLWVVGLQPIIAGLCGVYGSLLRARQKLGAVFIGGVASTITAISLGFLLTLKFGVAGACWSIVISYGVHHITLWLFSLDTWRPLASRAKAPETEAAAQEANIPC